MLKAKMYAAIILTLFLTIFLNSSLGIFIRAIFDKQKYVQIPTKNTPYSPIFSFLTI